MPSKIKHAKQSQRYPATSSKPCTRRVSSKLTIPGIIERCLATASIEQYPIDVGAGFFEVKDKNKLGGRQR